MEPASFPPAPDEETTIELLGRMRGGDDEAWNDLYRRYHDQLLFTIRMRLGHKLRRFLQSEDVFQSVALEAFTALKRFEYRGPGSLQRYLNTMVLNKLRDRADTYGAQKRDGGVPLPDGAADVIADPASDADQVGYFEGGTYDRLEKALADLPDDQREVVLLRKIEGLSSREVAELTGKSDAAVRKAYSRGLARLSARMVE